MHQDDVAWKDSRKLNIASQFIIWCSRETALYSVKTIKDIETRSKCIMIYSQIQLVHGANMNIKMPWRFEAI